VFDVEDGWRGRAEEDLLEDTDSEMLYQNAMDGFEDDVELNMQLGLAPMSRAEWFEALQPLPRPGLRSLIR
jgi:hypothetical protein